MSDLNTALREIAGDVAEVRVSVASIDAGMKAMLSRIDTSDANIRAHAETLTLLQSIETRRNERVRLAVFAGKLICGLVAVLGAIIGVMAQWGY